MKVANTDGDKSSNHKVSVKVTDRNHESREHKPSRHVEMFATKSVTICDKTTRVALMEFNSLQCTGKVGNKIRDKVRGLCRGHKS